MKRLVNKLTIPFLATVLLAVLSCVIQITHADSKLASTTSDDDEKGPPLSVAFHSNSVRTMSGSRNTENAEGSEVTRLTFETVRSQVVAVR